MDNSSFNVDESLFIKMNRSRLLLNEIGIDNSLSVATAPNPRDSLFRKSTNTIESSFMNSPSNLNRSLARNTISTLQANTTLDSNDRESTSNDSGLSGVYTQFKLDSNKYIDEENNLTDLLISYSNICSENVQFLNEKIQVLKLNRHNQDQLNLTIIEQENLEKEKHLWNLIYLLYRDEQEAQEQAALENENFDDENKENFNCVGINEVKLENKLLKKYPLMRRIKLIIDWMEKIAHESKSFISVKQKIGEFNEKCAGWEHTLHNLKHSNSNMSKRERLSTYSAREFVDELDPDAPIRQGKALHDLDQEDEYKIVEYIYTFVRAGDLDLVRDFCFKIGQPWRAATLEGFRLFNDRNYDLNHNDSNLRSSNQIYLNEGNLNRDIWRLMVQRLIKEERINSYEKATYACLAGFIGPVLPVCRTYMDFVWTYLKALYQHILDKEIRQSMSTLREFTDIIYDNEDSFLANITKTSSLSSLTSLQQIFDRIRVLINSSGIGNFASSNVLDKTISSSFSTSTSLSTSNQLINNLKADAQNPYSVILKYVILAGVDGFKSNTIELLDYLKTVLEDNNKQSGSLLRFSSHLSLFFKSASFELKNETFVEINEYYVKYLMKKVYKEIIAYYLSHLPNELQIKYYSQFLQSITDNKERQHLLKLAKERNMNVQAITLSIVDNLSRKSLTTNSPQQQFQNESKLLLNQTQTLSTTAYITKTTEQLFTKKTNQLLTDEDKTKINAIDWIIYDSMQRFKLLEYANLTMRYFLLERQNFEATSAVFSKIPHDTLTCIMQQYNFNLLNQTTNVETNLQSMIDNLPLNVTNNIKEYIGFKEYIDAVNIYNDWFEFFHREKPVKPISKFDLDSAQANQSNLFAERIAYDYQLKQYEDLLNRWNSKAKILCDKVRNKFNLLMKFPFGGWMVDIKEVETDCISDDEDEEDEQVSQHEDDTEMRIDDNESSMLSKPANEAKLREKQMKSLRKLYLPNMCFVLIDMFNKMKMNKDLIKVTDVVASEQYKLYNLFDQKQMKCFLNKIADASINLLDEGCDCIGYSNA